MAQPVNDGSDQAAAMAKQLANIMAHYRQHAAKRRADQKGEGAVLDKWRDSIGTDTGQWMV
jgi:hypothetical protein